MRTHHGRFRALTLVVALAGCASTSGGTEDGSVVVVLTNHVVDDIGRMAEPLVDAVGSV